MVQQISEDSHKLGTEGIELGMPEFRHVAVKLSKLVVQAWLNEGEGAKFKHDIMKYGLKGALQEQKIFFPGQWLTAELDTDTFIGSIGFSEACTWDRPNKGLELVWKIPYAPWPENGVTKDELREWIGQCDDWINNGQWENPEEPFPVPKNPYIPLASL